MSDVFISYANRDRERAREIASALMARGWSVWWDRNIKAGQAFDEVIERELETANNVVVLWSEASVSSEWVKNEAAVAVQRRVLVPVLLDDVKIPLEFRRKQTADLIGWDGDPSHRGLQALVEALQGPQPEVATAAASAEPPKAASRVRPLMAAGAAGLALGCALTYLVLGGWASSDKSATSTRPAASVPAQRSTKGPLPTNISTGYKGVVADVVGFEKAGELATVEWVFRSTSDQSIVICSYASQARLIDQVTGESWPALHSGGAIVRCENLRAGAQLGAWAKFKLPDLDNRRFSVSLPGLNRSPELPPLEVPKR